MASIERKPVGGITAAKITPLNGTSQPVRLVEQHSSYTEEVLCDEGILRIHHTLILVVPRAEAAALLAFAPVMATDGLSALITTAAGESLTVGWSELFGYEQPLRLTSLIMGSGTHPADGNAATLRFESDDRSALLEI
ncbi:MAG: hypothetical protein RRZ83_02755 [Alistipes sp.]